MSSHCGQWEWGDRGGEQMDSMDGETEAPWSTSVMLQGTPSVLIDQPLFRESLQLHQDLMSFSRVPHQEPYGCREYV